jgi:hypothetical protein
MLTYTNSKNYLLLSVAGVMVQGCVAYVDPYPETIVHTRSQNVVEARPPFFGFDVFYDYYDRPYYVDSYRRVIYVDTQYYPYVKSHYQYQKTDYGRHVEYHDDNHRDTYPHDQSRVIDKHDDNRGRGNPNDISKPNHVDNSIVNHSKDTEDKKNGASSNNSGRSNHNSNNKHSNDSERTY